MTEFLIRLFIKNGRKATGPVRERYGLLAGTVGVSVNFLLFLMKIAAGTVFHSIAITADAVNNLSDAASSLVTLIGFKISGKPADNQHPFGHARMEYISGLIVSFIILFLGLQLFQSSASKILKPEEAEFGLVSVVILSAAILMKLWLCLFYGKIAKTIDSMALKASSTDSRNDVVTTSAILAAAVATRFTGFNLDGYMGAAVALFILVSGVRIVMDTVNPLLGTAPTKELVNEIYSKILTYDGIIGLHDLSVHSYGADRCFASVHCEVSAEQDILISHDIIDNIERDFLSEKGIHLVIHLDPIVTSDKRTNELKKTVGDLVERISPQLSIHDFRVVWGVSHSNLIFDVVVPFDFPHGDEALKKRLEQEVHTLNETYFAVVTVDHSYVPIRRAE